VAGIGAFVSGNPADSVIRSIGFDHDGRRPVADRGSVSIYSQASSFSYTASISCVPFSRVKQRLVVGGLLPGEVETFRAACPRGTIAVGGGVLGQASPLLGSSPYDSRDRGKAPDDGWSVRVGSSTFASFAAEAICKRA
jgi:hypothetical protein